MLSIILILIVIGVLLVLVAQIPMDATILTLIRVVVIVGTVFWLIKALGLRLPF